MLEIAIFNPAEHFQQLFSGTELILGSSTEPRENFISISDDSVSDFQVRIELIQNATPGKVKITNLGSSMVLGSHARLHHLVVVEQELPCYLSIGETHVQITSCQPESEIDGFLERLDNIGSSSLLEVDEQKNRNEISPSPETLSSWFESLSQIQRSTAGQSEFFKQAARAVFNPGGLDGCIILRQIEDDWAIVAQHLPFPEANIGFRRKLIEKAANAKVPIFHDSANFTGDEDDSGNHAAVVCPVLDGKRNVAAIVYGFRCDSRGNNRKGVRRLEARFVSLIADSLSAGLIRLDQEADQARQRVLLEQAFSPEVAKQLEANPDILSGQERLISILFADMRGFCRISESVGPEITYQLLSDVMDRFSQIIHDQHGVIIDFYGDGMSAFWNAPVDQPRHAAMACNAAIKIQQAMFDLNQEWSTSIGQRLRVGIGVHTGNALVGNSGSRNRWKYGPQGSTVNIASRLEQSTKRLGVNLAISADTAQAVSDEFVPIKICTAGLNGIATPIPVFTLIDPIAYSKAAEWYDSYGRGLKKFEQGMFLDALEILSELADADAAVNHSMLEFLMNEITNRLPRDSNSSNQEIESLATLGSFNRSVVIL